MCVHTCARAKDRTFNSEGLDVMAQANVHQPSRSVLIFLCLHRNVFMVDARMSFDIDQIQ